MFTYYILALVKKAKTYSNINDDNVDDNNDFVVFLLKVNDNSFILITNLCLFLLIIMIYYFYPGLQKIQQLFWFIDSVWVVNNQVFVLLE